MRDNFIDKVFNEECLQGLKTLPDNSVDCCVTSPPYYGLRDYGTGHWEGGDANCTHESERIKTRFDYSFNSFQAGSKGTDVKMFKKICPDCGAVLVDDQIGLEESPQQYIDKLTDVFNEVYRVLKPDGTLWLNIGDSYVSKPKSNHDGKGKGLNDKSYGTGDTELGYDNQKDRFKTLLMQYKHKDLIGIPWMLAFALRNAGWYLRQDIIWHKPNPMPESVTDRCTKSHEYIFLLSKSQKYYFDYESISEPCADQNRTNYQSGSRTNGENSDRNDNDLGERSKDWKPRTKNVQYDGQAPNTMHILREQGYKDKEYSVRNKRDVWSVNVKADSVAHFATYPEELIKPCILAGCPSGGLILDPFMGSGTTAMVARKLNRHFVGFELNPDYCKIIEKKIQVSGDLFY